MIVPAEDYNYVSNRSKTQNCTPDPMAKDATCPAWSEFPLTVTWV